MNAHIKDNKSEFKIMLIFLILKMGLLTSLFFVGVVLFVQSAQITFELKVNETTFRVELIIYNLETITSLLNYHLLLTN